MSLKQQLVLLNNFGYKLNFAGKLHPGQVPLLFIHGAGGHALLWEKLLTRLPEKYSLLALDLPGHGCSGGKPSLVVSYYREVVRDFAGSMALPSFVLCGHSMGGAIAMDYALHYPRDLKAIVLIGTGGRLRVSAEILEKCGRGEKMPGLAGQLYGSQASEAMLRDGERIILQAGPEVWHADFTACHTFDLLPELRRINVPALILCGAEDRMTPPKYSNFLAENIPRVRLETFDGAGHMLMLEKPDEVSLALLNFFDDLGW